MNHPNLSDEINRNIAQSEIDGGVYICTPMSPSAEKKVLPVGKVLLVQTQNTLYRIEKRGEDDFWISGNANYCAQPVKANIHGSTWGGSMLKIGFVGRGMHLEFSTEGHPGVITTSEIKEVSEYDLQSQR